MAIQTVSELLTSGRIQLIYLDELGEIEELPIGVGLMVLTILESDAATQAARSLKLGNITLQLQEWIDLLGIDRLESLSEALLDFTSIADLESWLSEN